MTSLCVTSQTHYVRADPVSDDLGEGGLGCGRGGAGGVGVNTSYEGPSLANQKSRKLGVFDRKLEGHHSIVLLLLTNIQNNLFFFFF